MQNIEEMRSDSGATGGPGGGRGFAYEIDAAIYYALDLISRAVTLSMLTESSSRFIQIEPRHVEKGVVARLDIFVGSENVSIEAKAKPTDSDVTQFVQTARRALEQNANRRVRLFSGTIGCPKLRSLEQLIRVAIESDGNIDRFRKRLKCERIRHGTQLLEALGPSAVALLMRISVTIFPETVLTEQINFRLRHLVTPARMDEARQFLFESFGRGIQCRATIFVSELLREFAKRQIQVSPLDEVSVAELGEPAASTFYLLQTCATPIPTEVVARACNIKEADLKSALNDHIRSGNIVESGTDWLISPLINQRLRHARETDVAGNGLHALLEFIKANKTNRLSRVQLDNVLAIARSCVVVNPDACVPLFHDLQGILKARGDKQLVLRAAELTVEAAQESVRKSETTRRAEAEALICGMSWVYQRTGRLGEAESFAQKSLEIGQHVQWHRNSAFCQKCRGRLRRIQAERTAHKTKRKALLKESVALLFDALKLFAENTEEFGPEHPEIGDCYSLMGRTFFSADDRTNAERAAKKAEGLIKDHNSKDFLDLQILLGDIAVKKLKFPDGLKNYDRAIELAGDESAERSEIAARAWLHKALLLHRLRNDEWKNAIDKAEAIWQLLDEEYMAGLAQWTRLKIEDRVPEERARRLDAESPIVSVRFIELWERKLTAAGKLSAVAARGDIPDELFKELMAQAIRDVEVQHRDW